jgi:hypothetical protein
MYLLSTTLKIEFSIPFRVLTKVEKIIGDFKKP